MPQLCAVRMRSLGRSTVRPRGTFTRAVNSSLRTTRVRFAWRSRCRAVRDNEDTSSRRSAPLRASGTLVRLAQAPDKGDGASDPGTKQPRAHHHGVRQDARASGPSASSPRSTSRRGS